MGRLGIALLLTACAHDVPDWHRRPAAAPPLPPEPPPAQMTGDFAPRGEPALRYAEAEITAPQSALAARLSRTVGETAEANGRSAPAEDRRLDAVAADLAVIVGDSAPPYEAVDFALSFHGIIEPSPHIIVAHLYDDDQDALVSDLRVRLPPIIVASRFIRMGVGTAPYGPRATTVVLALQESALRLDPVPRALARGGAVDLRGEVLRPYTHPEVLVTAQNGKVVQVPIARAGTPGGFRAEIACGEAAGKLKVEVAAEDASGSPSILANFPVWCGAPPPRAIDLAGRAAAEVPKDVDEVERRLLALVNQDRAGSGLPALAWDDGVAAVARAHSTEMRDKSYVAHVSPTTGSAADRVRRAGILTPLVLENLARAYSAEEAQRGLMNSPGHRANLLSAAATDIGIGVALGDPAGGQREVYVTQLFIRKTPPIDHDAAVAGARETLGRARAAAGVPPVAEDETLDRLAEGYAQRLARTGDPKSVPGVNNQLEGLGGKYAEVVTLVIVTSDVDEVPKGAALDPRARYYGLGIGQGKHVEMGEGTIFIVLLVARGH